MDRLFLTALVREIGPRLTGKRLRAAVVWSPGGFLLAIDTRSKEGLVVSLLPDAPGVYLGRPPLADSAEGPPSRWKKLLLGAEIAALSADPVDRAIRCSCRRRRASGALTEVDLIVEWIGTRRSAFLVDAKDRRVLDVFSPATARLSPGETFEAQARPADLSPLASGASELRDRLGAARARGLPERAALRAASGLSPLLAEEWMAIHSAEGTNLEGAFEAILARLAEPRPTLLRREEPRWGDTKTAFLVSPIPLLPRAGWSQEVFASFNECAAAYLRESAELAACRKRYRELSTGLRTRLKKQVRLVSHLETEETEGGDPEEMRRWGELLLAGLRQARRVDGAVEVPDVYGEGREWVRIPIDPRRDLPANAKRFFDLSRKIERSRRGRAERLAAAREEIEHLETLGLALEDARGRDDLERVARELEEAGVPVKKAGGSARPRPGARGSPPPGIHRFVTSDGSQILAGRSARSNEMLTFDLAQPDDLWFHAAGSPGAHVVLRVPPGRPAAPDEIAMAARVAGYFSKARGSTSAEVVFTPRRHVRKIPGSRPGVVRLDRHESLRVPPEIPPGLARPDENRGSSREGER